MSGSITELVRTLVSVGATPQMILAAVETAEASKDNALEISREKARNRIKKWRDKQACNVTERSVIDTKRLTRGEDNTSKILDNKQVKKDISERHRCEEDFWTAYPRKVGKPAALKALSSALRKTDFATIMTGVRRYASERSGQDPNFTKHPGPWLNGEHWADEPTPRPSSRSTAPPPPREPRNPGERAILKLQGQIDDPTSQANGRLDSGDGQRQIDGPGIVRRYAGPALDLSRAG